MPHPQRRRKPNVLVVDDKHANLVALEAVLGGEHNLLYAACGPDALSHLRTNPRVDVILMDVQMPGMDGFEAARLIKQLPGCEEIPIIFVTAVYREDAFIKQGYAAGGIDYFGKPFDPDILRMKVSIYSSFRQRSELLRERELHIRESEELLRVGHKLGTLLESLAVGVLIADIEGRICQITDEVSRILRAVEPARSDSYGAILGWWDDAGQSMKDRKGPLARALALGATSNSEPVTIRCLDGTVKTILASASPLRGLDGKILGAVILVRDLTEGRKIESDLMDRVAKLVNIGVELEESGTR